MTLNEFLKELENLNISLNDKQIKDLNTYYDLLIEYNKVMNLTAITDKNEVYLKHFYDSLTLVKVIKLNNQSLCDIGTGAGFPGLVLKIVFPSLKVTLLDALNKRVNFLNEVIKKLDLKNIEVIHVRAEEYALKNRNKFDITTARAVAHTSILLEYGIPMTKVGGNMVLLKGNMDAGIENALNILNTKLVKKIEFKLPLENSNRTIIVFLKEKDNLKYPRKNSEIKKKRL